MNDPILPTDDSAQLNTPASAPPSSVSAAHEPPGEQTPAKRRTFWRAINTAIILFAFFAPWLNSCGSDQSGFQITLLYGMLVPPAVASILVNPIESIVTLLFFIGNLGLLIYCALNLGVIFWGLDFNTQFRKKFLRRALASGVIGLVVITYSRFTSESFTVGDVRWGYWLVWAGVGSSVWLEISLYLPPRPPMSKLRWLAVFAILLSIGIVLPKATYYTARTTYYWHWWGQNDIWARNEWLCNAPPGFEQSLYPANVEVLMPACDGYLHTILPGGDKLFGANRDGEPPHLFVLDVQTREKTPYPFEFYDAGYGGYFAGMPLAWLTDELFVRRATPTETKGLRLTDLSLKINAPFQKAYDYYSTPERPMDPNELLNLLSQLQTQGAQLYSVRLDCIGDGDYLIAYNPNHPEQSQIITIDIAIEGKLFEDWLTTHNIPYRRGSTRCNYCDESASPSGRYILKEGEIYDRVRDQSLVSLRSLAFQGLHPGDEGSFYELCSWLPDESAAILRPTNKMIRREFSEPRRTKQPILLFKMPQAIAPPTTAPPTIALPVVANAPTVPAGDNLAVNSAATRR